MSEQDGVHVALLRGINVGGRRKLPMQSLVTMFERAGARDIRTYIQSGNVVFRAAPEDAPRIASDVVAQISQDPGYDVPVICRTRSEWAHVADSNPFLARGEDEATLHVAFLASRPEDGEIATLDPDRSPPDEFYVSGREIFLYLPNGVARSKLTNAYLDARLDTVATIRNWRTVGKLLKMAMEI